MILKFLSGGTAPFVQYLPLQINTARAAGGESSSKNDSSSSSSKNDGKLTQKDLLTMLKDIDGLPSDMEALYNNMVNFMRMGEVYGDIDTSMLSTQYIRALRNVKTAIFRKEVFDNAYDRAKENGGLNEVAITDTGKILGMDKDGKIQTFNPEEFDSENYQLLTNSDVLNLRANDINYANNDELSKIVSNGIGLDHVNKLIHDYMASLGTDTVERTGEYRDPAKVAAQQGLALIQLYEKSGKYSVEELNKIASGISESAEASVNGATEPGLYKKTELNKTQAKQVMQALDYIYAMLPQNAKTLLKVKTGNKENSLGLIKSLIDSGTSSESKIVWDKQTEKTTDGSGDGSGTKKDNDPVTGFILGLGYQQPSKINIGNSRSIGVNGRYSTLVDKSGNILAPNSTLSDVAKSAFGSVLKMDLATMGGERLSGDIDKVLINDATIIRVDLPIDKKELQKTGYIKPDLALTSRIEDAEFDIRNKHITDENLINQIYQKHELPPKFVKKGNKWEINQHDYTSFAMIGAVAEERAFTDPDNLTWLLEIEDPNRKDYITRTLKKNDEDYSDSTWFGLDSRNLYQGQIFIPIKDNLVAASYGSGNYYKLPASSALEVEEKLGLQLQYKPAVSLSEIQ